MTVPRLERLRELRESKYWTQEKLAQESGVHAATINRLEQGAHAARFSTVLKLAEALGVEPSELVGDE